MYCPGAKTSPVRFWKTNSKVSGDNLTFCLRVRSRLVLGPAVQEKKLPITSAISGEK